MRISLEYHELLHAIQKHLKDRYGYDLDEKNFNGDFETLVQFERHKSENDKTKTIEFAPFKEGSWIHFYLN